MAGHRGKVLIVDDDPGSLEILLDVLVALDVESVGASSAPEALRKFHDEDIGLVITDVRMPGICGLDLLVTLKHEAPDLPVVLISSHDIDVIKLEKEAARADMILSKPYLISDIIEVVQRFL